MAGSTLAGCGSPRDRPTGPVDVSTVESVTILTPRTGDLVAADSIRRVTVEARGRLSAVELILIRTTAPDTFFREQRSVGNILDVAEVSFDIRFPNLETGANLSLYAAALDRDEELVFSEPVVVLVVDCNQFPDDCRDLPGGDFSLSVRVRQPPKN
jgi:hypothetical protein